MSILTLAFEHNDIVPLTEVIGHREIVYAPVCRALDRIRLVNDLQASLESGLVGIR